MQVKSQKAFVLTKSLGENYHLLDGQMSIFINKDPVEKSGDRK